MGQLYSTLEVGSSHPSRTSLEWALQRLHSVLPHSTGVTYRVYKSETERFSVLCVHQYDENLRVRILNRELRVRWIDNGHNLKDFIRASIMMHVIWNHCLSIVVITQCTNSVHVASNVNPKLFRLNPMQFVLASFTLYTIVRSL
jgi:hypothetical protein